MLKHMIQKELLAIVRSPKFVATFALCSALMIFSVIIGIVEYKASVDQYETGRHLALVRMQAQTNWSQVAYRAYRPPDPLQIFVSGATFDLGRWSPIHDAYAPTLYNSEYSEDAIFAVFRLVDFSFIIVVIATLLAIVFTYDAVCGERENGTLRLVFSNPVSRARYLIAKCAGAWLGLVIPLSVPVLVSLLLLQLFRIPLTGTDWLRLVMCLVMAVLLVTFFVIFGVLMSTLTRRSSISFMLSLVCWIGITFVVPRVCVLAADQLEPVPSLRFNESQKGAFSNTAFKSFMAGMPKRIDGYVKQWGANDPRLQERIREAEAPLLDAIRDSAMNFETKLLEEQRRAEVARQRLAFSLCLVSPSAAYQLASMAIANTDVGLKQRFEDAGAQMRRDFIAFRDRRAAEQSEAAAPTDREFRFRDGVLSMSGPGRGQKLNLDGFPEFAAPRWSLDVILGQVALDAGLLFCFIFAAFAGAWVAFLRYDLR